MDYDFGQEKAFDCSKLSKEETVKHIIEKNSWYFRNALVRANYTNMNKSICMNTEYLEKFFRNLLLGESNELKNQYCHIKFNEKVAIK